MKKLVWVVAMVWVAAVLFGAEAKKEATSASKASSKASSVLDSFYKPGTFAINVGFDLLALAWGGFGAYPGIEFTFSQYAIDNKVPLDFGVAVQGYYYTFQYVYFTYSWSYNYLGVGLFGTAHFGPKNSMADVPDFLKHLDFYAGVGIFLQNYWVAFSDPTTQSYYDQYVKPNAKTAWLGFASIGGVTYFFTDSFGIRFDGTYYGYGGTTISAVFKF